MRSFYWYRDRGTSVITADYQVEPAAPFSVRCYDVRTVEHLQHLRWREAMSADLVLIIDIEEEIRNNWA